MTEASQLLCFCREMSELLRRPQMRAVVDWLLEVRGPLNPEPLAEMERVRADAKRRAPTDGSEP